MVSVIDVVWKRDATVDPGASRVAVIKRHQTVRFREGQRPQQKLIHKTEDGRVRANAEGESQTCHYREAGILGHHA